ncbi:DUF4157 domain-containing protein [Haloferax sp. S1W]|uniref:DUF4157 domain-containing protein n=1 Tax=Haloferax sp. S1W TaxID=3377110 RepID=UPI0037C736DC
MGFRSAKEKTSEGQRSSTVPSIQELTGGSDRSQRGGGSSTAQGSAAQFGLELYRPGMDVQIQRLVESHGASQVRQWADEGMTVDTMGKPRDMRQFRERQQDRSAEIPKDIERRNAKSVQRSRNAHHEASKAGDAQVPDSVRDVISSPGQQLDTSIQRAMEGRMGDNLGDVRIHTGPTAAKACEDINARAFTVGNHIAFNHGEYDPSSAEGQHVLAHELAHVRQQTGGVVSMLPQEGELEIDPDPRLEREAEETAERVMRGGELGIFRMQHSDVHVQRMATNSDGNWLGYDVGPFNSGGSKDDEDKISSDPEVLATEVKQINERLTAVEETVNSSESTASAIGKAAVQGTVGTVGGLLGAVAGSSFMPGIGTIGGAVVGQEVAKGVAGDVTKSLTGKAYDKGSAVASEKMGAAKEYIENLIDEKLDAVFGDSETGTELEGKAQSRGDR